MCIPQASWPSLRQTTQETYDFQRVNLPIDATETLANPWALAVVARKGLPTKYHPELENIALEFAAAAIL